VKISHLSIENFRGVKTASLYFPDHVVLIGDNNTGKSTVFEAIDLVLGPDRLSRRAPIDEHDFYMGRYLPPPQTTDSFFTAEVPPPAPRIVIGATITELSADQQSRFGDYIEWWNKHSNSLYQQAEIEGVDSSAIVAALRVTFIGQYDAEEDDFEGSTYFTRTLFESDAPQVFTKKDKQHCGFLYLRSLRTGSRALSLEHGSLLDIILRLKEIRPQMWEDTISNLSAFNVASNPELGISGVLESINAALKKYVPREWGVRPHLKVSSLTREHLRKVVTAFVATGEGEHAAPFFRQGTGTINMLVLAMLSQIAEDK
jgi:putative ATP-dependent endonuclease of the OLD family